jgi:hypothetical protein
VCLYESSFLSVATDGQGLWQFVSFASPKLSKYLYHVLSTSSLLSILCTDVTVVCMICLYISNSLLYVDVHTYRILVHREVGMRMIFC